MLHLCEDGQFPCPAPQGTRSPDSSKDNGVPYAHGLSNRGRHKGTGGHGSLMQFNCIILHSSPLPHRTSVSHGLGLHSQTGQPFESRLSPNSHCKEHFVCGHCDGSEK